MVMESEKLLEKQANAAGLSDVKATISCSTAATSSTTPCCRARSTSTDRRRGFLTLWAKAKDNPAIEIRGLS
jgi:hypothetical protein